MVTLTSSQRAYLRRLAHHLQPTVQVGKSGLTTQVLASIDQALDSHELIKVKFISFQEQRKALSQEIAERLNTGLVGVIGNIAIFYRESPDPEKHTIDLPD